VYVIGRPGSGKTTLAKLTCRALNESNIEATIVSDYEFLSRVFADQSSEGKLYVPCADGGYLVLTERVFDNAIRKLSNKIGQIAHGQVILAEFSRSNYRDSFRLLDLEGCIPDLVAYLEASFETCLRRNEIRRADPDANDTHYVSREEMAKTYRVDDVDRIQLLYGRQFIRLDNELDGLFNASKVARKLARIIASKVKRRFVSKK